MKSKFIMWLAIPLALAVLAFLGLPMVTPDLDVGVAEASAGAEVYDLAAVDGEVVWSADVTMAPDDDVGVAAMDSEVVVITEANDIMDPSMPREMWLALGAGLLTIAVTCRRRLTTISTRLWSVIRRTRDALATEGAFCGGGPNAGILPGGWPK